MNVSLVFLRRKLQRLEREVAATHRHIAETTAEIAERQRYLAGQGVHEQALEMVRAMSRIDRHIATWKLGDTRFIKQDVTPYWPLSEAEIDPTLIRRFQWRVYQGGLRSMILALLIVSSFFAPVIVLLGVH